VTSQQLVAEYRQHAFDPLHDRRVLTRVGDEHLPNRPSRFGHRWLGDGLGLDASATTSIVIGTSASTSGPRTPSNSRARTVRRVRSAQAP
jgi:hypothetical protein